MNVIMNRIETLEELVETYKKCPYKVETYEFDGTGYALLIIEINKMLKENQQLKDIISRTKDELYIWGEILNPEFQKRMLEILEKSDSNE